MVHTTKRIRTQGFAGIFFLALSAITSPPATGAEWVRIGTADDDDWRAFDVARTSLIAPNTIRTWKRYSLRGHDVKYPGYQYSITEWEIDCARKQHRILSSFDYDSNGRIVNTDLWKDSELRPIPPDSKGDLETAAICARVIKVGK